MAQKTTQTDPELIQAAQDMWSRFVMMTKVSIVSIVLILALMAAFLV